MPNSRNSKKNRSPTQVRRILGENVSILRDLTYGHLANTTKRNIALGKDIGAQLGQVQRICAGAVGTSIDTVEWLAAALGVAAHELLKPHFAAARIASQLPSVSQMDSETLLQRSKS